MMAAETKAADAAADAAAYGAEAASSGGLPQFDMTTWSSQIFWLVLTFGLLYIVLAKILLPRIGGGLSERGDRIADDLDAASRMQKQSEQAMLEHERVMAAAKAKAHNIAETTRRSVDAEIEAEMVEAEAELSRRQAQGEERISAIRQQALSHIDEVARDTAQAIAEKIGQIKPTAAQIKAAVVKAGGHD